MIIGAILQAASISYSMLVVARIVTGLGNGLNVREVIQVFKSSQGRSRPPQYPCIMLSAHQRHDEEALL